MSAPLISPTTRASLLKGGVPLLIAVGVLLCVDFAWSSPPAYAEDVLSIATANLGADLLIILAAFYSGIVPKSSLLLTWYRTYGLSAMLADTLIGVLYMLVAVEVAEAVDHDVRLTTYGAIAVGVQWVGDLGFALLFTVVPRGRNAVFDVFKDYAQEAQLGALLGDSFLVVVAVLYASALASVEDVRHVVYVLIAQLYLVPYVVHAKGGPGVATDQHLARPSAANGTPDARRPADASMTPTAPQPPPAPPAPPRAFAARSHMSRGLGGGVRGM
jgi:hypothetical protein